MKKNICLFLVLVFLMTGARTGLSLMKYIPLETLVQQSDQIVLGQVAGIRSYWNPAHTMIYTEIKIINEKKIKGADNSPASQVIIKGGSVGEIGQWVSDQPKFVSGEKVILFLKTSRSGSREIAGQIQGKYSVVTDLLGQAQVVSPQFQAMNNSRNIASFSSRALPLNEFIQKIEALSANETR